MCESVYWVNINTDIEKHIKGCKHFSWVSADTAQGEDNTSWHTAETMGNVRCGHIPAQYQKLLMYHRLLQQIPSDKEDGGVISSESNCNNKGHICRIWYTT